MAANVVRPLPTGGANSAPQIPKLDLRDHLEAGVRGGMGRKGGEKERDKLAEENIPK